MKYQKLAIQTHQLSSAIRMDKVNALKKGYTDIEVIAAIKNSVSTSSQLALKWFFEEVKGYAIGVWRKKYRHLSEIVWEDIYADSSITVISRIKKGLKLQEGTKLKSYFTMIVGYAVLEYFAQRKKAATLPIEEVIRTEATSDNYPFEEQQIAFLIKEKLLEITDNSEQVKVILLFAKGYKYKEIVAKTSYQSEGACRNAYVKGKKKIIKYLMQHPLEGRRLKEMLAGTRFR